MQCGICGVEKLDDEFPRLGITDRCEHAATVCLRCLIEGGLEHCPECSATLSDHEAAEVRAQLAAKHCEAFQELAEVLSRQQATAMLPLPEQGAITVSLMDGQRFEISICRTVHIEEVKDQIGVRTGVPATKQLLKHMGQDVPSAPFADTGLSFGVHLQLVILMYELRPARDMPRNAQLSFHLRWEGASHWISGGRKTIDHLNGSAICLGTGGDAVCYVDFRHSHRNAPGIWHGGPSREGRSVQVITVDLAQVPSVVVLIFFALSAGKGALDRFRNPSVRLLDASDKPVCDDYTLADAGHRQAVVMCCAARNRRGGAWQVTRCGRPSGGHVKRYDELDLTVLQLREEFFGY